MLTFVDTEAHTRGMTQTIEQGTYRNTVPSRVSDRVRVAMTVGREGDRYVPLRVHLFDLRSVAEAREEFGATLADATEFVQSTSCVECGEVSSDITGCASCGVKLCRCALVLQHDDELACRDCDRPCYGRCCSED